MLTLNGVRQPIAVVVCVFNADIMYRGRTWCAGEDGVYEDDEL
jgi:hypothetical protein